MTTGFRPHEDDALNRLVRAAADLLEPGYDEEGGEL